MRILAIRGAQLASLAVPFEVDLDAEPLRSAGVFAIVGPTGAGKSSLFDALCLALFDTTPRLLRAPRQCLDEAVPDHTARDARSLVRRGAASAHAEVDFLGIDGRRHRARWSVDRARTGKLRMPQLSVRELPEGPLVAGNKTAVLAAIEARLGFGLAELRRAVLLPQGELAAFLDAPADERATILERLTGAEVFGEISRVVHERAAEARRAVERVEAGLRATALLSPEESAAHATTAARARLEAARADERIAAWMSERDRHAAIARLRLEEHEARASLAEVERQRELAELSRADVELAERVEALADLVHRADHAQRAVAGARARCAREVERSADARARAVALGGEVARADLALAELTVRASASRAEGERRREAARADVENARRAASVLDTSTIRAEQAAASEALASLDRALAARGALARATEALRAATDRADTADAAARALTDRARELDADVAAQEARLEEAVRAHELALVARSLTAHRAVLVEGEPCPLCGASEHAPEAARAIDAMTEETAGRVASIRMALARTRATQERVGARGEGHRRDAASARGEIEAANEARSVALRDADRTQTEAHAQAEALGVDASDVEQIRAALDALTARLAERATRIDRARAFEREAALRLGTLDAAEQERRLHEEAAQREVVARLEQTRARHAAALARSQAMEEAIARVDADMALAIDANARADDELATALRQAALTDADLARVRALDPEATRRARADLARLDRERAVARARLDDREARRAAVEADAPAAALEGEALDAAIATARSDRDHARRDEASAEAVLAQDSAARRDVASRADDLARANAELARWAGLDASIGSADGKRFRVHAQAITLDRLVAFANAELAQLAPRYRLARSPSAADLALVVIDHDDGEVRRSVQSLSGGESFLVSLGLALGLAAMTVAEGGRGLLRESSLFLDEGLGALDPDSLEIALGALETLRASGRQIAIVTHVPQVAERFAARVEVIPRGAGKSEVRVCAG
jgi:exonuclease SbcC